jgi:hypothetical protein
MLPPTTGRAPDAVATKQTAAFRKAEDAISADLPVDTKNRAFPIHQSITGVGELSF